MGSKRRGVSSSVRQDVEAVLTALRDGLISEWTAERLLWEHAAAVCPTCRRSLAAALEQGSDANRIEEWLLSRGLIEAEDDARARAERQRLLRIDDLQTQLETLARATVRFRQPLTAALLLDEAFGCFHDDAETAGELAHLAQVVAYRAGHPLLEAVAWGYRGNALRAQGKLTEADPFFARARFLLRGPHLRPHETQDAFFLAELDSLEGTLRADQRRFDAAAALLHSARSSYQRARSSKLDEARVLLQLGSLGYYQGDSARARDLVAEATRLIDPFQAPRLHLWAYHNLALYWTECGAPSAARDLLVLLKPLYREAARLPQLRLQWLQGRIATASNEWSEARRLLLAAAESFMDRQHYLFAAFVCLDLADLYVSTGHPTEIRAVTACLPIIFRSQHLDREATAALLVFHRAVQADELDRELLARVRQKLAAAQAVSCP